MFESIGTKNIKATFIGNYNENKELMALRGEINLIDKMSYENYLKYVSKNANAAFMSLTNELSQYCVPSKLYDYINLELPILGHIQGQAKEIIVNEKFGLISSNINELKSTKFITNVKLSEAEMKFLDISKYKEFKFKELVSENVNNILNISHQDIIEPIYISNNEILK